MSFQPEKDKPARRPSLVRSGCRPPRPSSKPTRRRFPAASAPRLFFEVGRNPAACDPCEALATLFNPDRPSCTRRAASGALQELRAWTRSAISLLAPELPEFLKE